MKPILLLIAWTAIAALSAACSHRKPAAASSHREPAAASNHRKPAAASTAATRRPAPRRAAAEVIPPPGTPAWNQLVDRRLGVTDAAGHGPDLGSEEWMGAVGKKAGVTGVQPGSQEWSRAVEAQVFGAQ